MTGNAHNLPIFEFTFGEMQRLAKQPRFWVSFVIIVLMLSISGPFNTTNTMTFPERMAFWLLTSGLTFAAGFFTSMFFGEWFQRLGLAEISARILAGLLAGLPVAVIVWLVGLLLFDFNVGRNATAMLLFIGQCAVISAAVSAIFILLPRRAQSETEDEIEPSKRDNPFFERLPIALGRDVISLQAQDHYLKVTTTKGSELVLQRLSDACKELADSDGLQVHRSWWVSTAHVEKLEKNNSKISLRLSDGQEVPVSRGFASAVKQRFARLEVTG